MMARRITTIILIVAAVVCLRLGGAQNAALAGMRAHPGIGVAALPADAPPLMAFTTIVLGGFRGLIADILWLRATYLQERGEYLELVQLSDWITKLDPRSTEVWSYHAWNLAYNISVMMTDPEDRWRWVNNGIRLLRDEGLLYNPNDPDLYRELGWLYQDKLGRDMDLAGFYYRKMLAQEMTQLFGGPKPDYDHITPEMEARMISEYKLIPAVMREVDAKYGPLNWLEPQTHAIYWAYRGLLCAGKDGSKMCEAMIRQSLMMMSDKKEK